MSSLVPYELCCISVKNIVGIWMGIFVTHNKGLNTTEVTEYHANHCICLLTYKINKCFHLGRGRHWYEHKEKREKRVSRKHRSKKMHVHMQVKLVCFAINLKISRNLWEIISAHLSDYFDYSKWVKRPLPYPKHSWHHSLGREFWTIKDWKKQDLSTNICAFLVLCLPTDIM